MCIRDSNLYLRLVHCITSNSSYCRPLKSPLVKSNAGNNTTIITFFLDGRRCKVSKLITLVIRRTRAHNLYLRLVHCITSNSSYCRPLKSPSVNRNAGNNTTIITCFLGGRRCKVSKLITLVIRRTRACNLYPRLVHCETSNSSFCRSPKSPFLKSNMQEIIQQ